MAESGNADVAVIEPIQDADLIASLQEHAGQVRPDIPCAPGDEDSARVVPVVGSGPVQPRVVQQLVQRCTPGPMQVLSHDEPRHAPHRSHADARLLHTPDERADQVWVGRWHRHEHLRHVVLVGDGQHLRQRTEDGQTIEKHVDLVGVIVDKADELHPLGPRPGELPADGEPMLPRAGDQYPMGRLREPTGGRHRARHAPLDRPPFRFRHLPPSQCPHPDAGEQREQHDQENGRHRERNEPCPPSREQHGQ